MIAHITHGNDIGGVLDYLTKEAANKSKPQEAKKAQSDVPDQESGNQKSGNQESLIPAAGRKTDDNLQSENDLPVGQTSGGHSQYPRRGHSDDHDENYLPNRRWRVIGGNLPDDNKQAVREIDKITGLRPDIRKPILHVSLSAHPDDIVTTRQWREIGGQFLDDMKLTNAPYLIIQHRDQEHDHIHVVTSRIDISGNVNDAWRERHRAQSACVKIEAQFGLKKAGRDKAEQTEKKKQIYSENSAIFRVQQKIDTALDSMTKPGIAEFVEQLEKNRVLVKAKFSSQGEVLGLSFAVQIEKNRRKYDEKKLIKVQREQKEKEKILRSADKSNGHFKVTFVEEKNKNDKLKTISFPGSKLGEKYHWDNLKSILNYTKQDNPILASATERADREEFHPVENPELKEVHLKSGNHPPAEKTVLTAVSVSTRESEHPIEAKHSTVSSKEVENRSFFDSLQDYLPQKIADFISPAPVALPEKKSVNPILNESVKPEEKQQAKETRVTDQIKKPPLKISAFDLALEKQLMAAEISGVFHEINENGYPLAAREILELNERLKARSIYPEFFFDGNLIRGIRFSKLHRETNEIITFKGSELNIMILKLHTFEKMVSTVQKPDQIILQNLTATPKNIFDERVVSPAVREKINEANSEFTKVKKGFGKVSKNTIFEAALLDEKVNEVFENHFRGYVVQTEEPKKDLEMFYRIKNEFLKRANEPVTDDQAGQIQSFQKEVTTRIDNFCNNQIIGFSQNASNDQSKYEDDSIFSELQELKQQNILFFDVVETNLEYEFLISKIAPQPESHIDSAQNSINREAREISRMVPYPPVGEQQKNYFDAMSSRLDELGIKTSEKFDSLFRQKLDGMGITTLIKPNFKYENDLSDVLTPYGNLFLNTRNDIINRDDWNKYDEQDIFASELQAATFVLENGNENEINDLLDHHISELQNSESELNKREQQQPSIEQKISKQLEM